MIQPDILTVFPRHLDYPLFRLRMRQWKDYFGKIFVGMTKKSFYEDNAPFLREAMPYAFMDFAQETFRKDWRDEAVNSLLEQSVSEWVCFLEPDFLTTEHFWQTVLRNVQHSDCIYYMEGTRIHPAFCLVKKELVMKTSKNFSAEPPQYDHFGRFFHELMQTVQMPFNLPEMDLVDRFDYFHMGGLSQNYYNHVLGIPLYKPYEFLTYNVCSTELPIKVFPSFRLTEEEIKKKHGEHHISFIEAFFQEKK